MSVGHDLKSLFWAFLIAGTISASAADRMLPLPDPYLTPGVADRHATAKVVCSTKWGKSRRHVTAAMRKKVFAEYLLTGNSDPYCKPKGCELDHLISRELGGADDVRNLWPEPKSGPWNAQMKDRLENRLRHEVCYGDMSLGQAQRLIVKDWTVA